jgi:hypothetical protein
MQNEARKALLNKRTQRFTGIFLGGTVVSLGLLLLLDNLEIIRVDEVWRLWPILLIGWGLAHTTEARTPTSFVWGGLVMAIGVALILSGLGILYVGIGWNLIWPLLIVGVGLSLLLQEIDANPAAKQSGDARAMGLSKSQRPGDFS